MNKNKYNKNGRRKFESKREFRDSIKRRNAREFMYNALHQSLDLEVNTSTRIKSLYKAGLLGQRYKANPDTIIKGLLDIKPIADASQETFLNKVQSATASDLTLSGTVVDSVYAMYVIPTYAQSPDIRTFSTSSDGSSSYTMPRTRDFVASCNDIFTLLQSNSAYSTTPIMSYSTYGPSTTNVDNNVITLSSSTIQNTPDPNPFWTAAITQNAIWSFADSACVNVAAMSSILMTWRQDRVLLDIFARRHPEQAGWILDAKARISTPRFRTLLENIARLLSRIPVDNDWVDRVVRTSSVVSQKSDSILEPVVYTSGSYMMPDYCVGTSTTSSSGFFFTPDFRNTNWRTENASMPCQPFYSKNVAFGSVALAPGLIEQLLQAQPGAQLQIVTQWVDGWLSKLTTALAQASSLVNMFQPWTALVRLAAQSGFAKWFGYVVPYLEEYKPSYDANVHNLLRYPSVKMKNFASNGNATYEAPAVKGMVNEDSVSPYKIYKVATEYSFNTNSDAYYNCVPHFSPMWDNNDTNSVDGTIQDAPYQFPELALYTYVYADLFNTQQLTLYQTTTESLSNNDGGNLYIVDGAWALYNTTLNPSLSYGSLEGVNMELPNGFPSLNYLIDTLGAIGLGSSQNWEGWVYAPLLTADSSLMHVSVIIPNVTLHLQSEFRASTPFRVVMKNPGDVLLLG